MERVEGFPPTANARLSLPALRHADADQHFSHSALLLERTLHEHGELMAETIREQLEGLKSALERALLATTASEVRAAYRVGCRAVATSEVHLIAELCFVHFQTMVDKRLEEIGEDEKDGAHSMRLYIDLSSSETEVELTP